MTLERQIKICVIALIFVAIALGAILAWSWRGHLASDSSSLAEQGSCFLVYRIGEQQLRVQTPDGRIRIFNHVTSGDGNIESIGKRNVGPVPPGAYVVLTRDEGRATYQGQAAFVLDPVDGVAGNDRVDSGEKSLGGGRSAFRIHGGQATQGCLASLQIDEIAELLLGYVSEAGFDIYSRPADSGREGIKRFKLDGNGEWQSAPDEGDWELFEQEKRVGLLWVLP